MKALATLSLVLGTTLLFGGCPSGQIIVQASSIPPGLYIGDRECSSTINGEESTTVDSIRFTIDNNGLLVLNGETIHVGLANNFETGTFSQLSVIGAIAVSADGFTIDQQFSNFRRHRTPPPSRGPKVSECCRSRGGPVANHRAKP